MRILKISITSLVILLIMAACGEATIEKVDSNVADAASGDQSADNGSDETEAEDVDSDADAVEEEVEEVVEDDLGVGDTINFNGLHVTLKGVRTSQGEEYFEPDQDFFLILDFTMDNTTDEAAHVSTLMQMTLLDPDSYSQNIDLFADTKGSLDGEIGAGRKLAGEVSFDVEDADFFEFIFDDPFYSGQAIWTIERSDWE